MKKFWLLILLFIPNISVDAKDFVYLNLNKSEHITISLDDSNNLSASLKGSSNINIKDLNMYQSNFLTDDDNNYPLYIIYSNNEYSFSDFKKSNSEVYILSSKMLTIGSSSGATSLANTCESLFGVQLINLLKNNVLKIIYITIPLILIVFSTLDFAKLVFSDDKEGVPGALKKFGKRVIAAILIFLIPNILIFLTTVLGADEVRSCVEMFKTDENINAN